MVRLYTRTMNIFTRHKKNIKPTDWSIPIDLFDQSSVNAQDSRFVSLRGALESEAYKQATTPLSFPIGRDESGNFVIADFQKLSHIIAGGQTGSGKSSFTEGALLASLIYRNSPEDLKLILIDPKVVQFPQYNDLPHLLRPVITTSEQSREAIDWLLDEMEERFKILNKERKRDIVAYNASGENHMPYILLVIDEVSDLMMVDGKYYEESFIKLLQKSRAVGIHLYIGTSRPNEDVYPGLLRANFPTALAFKTASKVDSEKLLDFGGAENLLGTGDLLFSSLARLEPLHIQVPYASEEEQVRLVKFIVDHQSDSLQSQ